MTWRAGSFDRRARAILIMGGKVHILSSLAYIIDIQHQRRTTWGSWQIVSTFPPNRTFISSFQPPAFIWKYRYTGYRTTRSFNSWEMKHCNGLQGTSVTFIHVIIQCQFAKAVMSRMKTTNHPVASRFEKKVFKSAEKYYWPGSKGTNWRTDKATEQFLRAKIHCKELLLQLFIYFSHWKLCHVESFFPIGKAA